MNDIKRLYRSRNERMIAGVCGGLGEYLNLDATVIRILFLAALFFGGAGLFLYIAMVIVTPEKPDATQ